MTFAIINRRPSQRDGDRDVLEKVTLIKDIDVVNPHRAHLEILADLSLDALYHRHEFINFLELHQAWQKTLDTSELNRRFFKEIADWYFWAVDKVTFPSDAGDNETVRSILHNGTPDADSRARFLTFKTFIGDPNLENRRERTRTYTVLAQAGTRDNRYSGTNGAESIYAPLTSIGRF